MDVLDIEIYKLPIRKEIGDLRDVLAIFFLRLALSEYKEDGGKHKMLKSYAEALEECFQWEDFNLFRYS